MATFKWETVVGSLVIRPGQASDVDVLFKIANAAKTLPALGGFTTSLEVAGWFEKGNVKLPWNDICRARRERQ